MSTDNKEFEKSIKKWKQYFKDNQGKIPGEFPKTNLDKFLINANPKPNVNEVKKLSKLINDNARTNKNF